MRDLGFDQWFEGPAAQCPGRTAALHGNGGGSWRLLIRNELNEVPAELAGRLSFRTEDQSDLPCVGDWVTAQFYNEDTAAIIHGVFPRKTFLRRRSAGEHADYQRSGPT
jgi:ribosome biogenesis GTPase